MFAIVNKLLTRSPVMTLVEREWKLQSAANTVIACVAERESCPPGTPRRTWTKEEELVFARHILHESSCISNRRRAETSWKRSSMVFPVSQSRPWCCVLSTHFHRLTCRGCPWRWHWPGESGLLGGTSATLALTFGQSMYYKKYQLKNKGILFIILRKDDSVWLYRCTSIYPQKWTLVWFYRQTITIICVHGVSRHPKEWRKQWQWRQATTTLYKSHILDAVALAMIIVHYRLRNWEYTEVL